MYNHREKQALFAFFSATPSKPQLFAYQQDLHKKQTHAVDATASSIIGGLPV
jgi:hypothetical protein